MASLLRNAFLLKRSVSQPQLPTGFNREILGTFQNFNFSTRGRKRSKSNESDLKEENMSKKVFALQRAMDHINSAFGKGSITWLGRSVTQKNVHVMSTGSFAVNAPLGIGGLPKGFKQGTSGISQKLSFSTKGRRRSKSDGSDSCEENMSKKDLALQQAMDQITTTFGKGSIMWLGRTVSPKNIPVVSTGSFALDIALGVGGLPKGRVVEIFGPEASGKTTLALHVIAEAQKSGGYCAFVDAEHALDKALAESIGVNTENLLLSQPDCGEQALSLVDTLIRSGSLDVIVVDSVAALVPKGELDGEMGDAHMAMQARLMSQALRKLCHSLSLSQCVLIFINQVRSKLSTFGGFGGPTEVTCGGNALKFYASVRLNIKRIGLIKKGEETLGSQVQVKVVKNKLAPPFKVAQFELEFGKGISRDAEIIELSLKHKLVSKHGSFYHYNGQNFHGKDALKKFLAQGDGAHELTVKLREKLLSSETELVPEAQVLSTADMTEEMVSFDSTDEEAAAAVEA